MGLFTIKTPSKAQSLLKLAMIDAATGVFEISSQQMIPSWPFRIYSYNLVVHHSWTKFIDFDNEGGCNCELCVTIIALWLSQQQVIFHKQI